MVWIKNDNGKADTIRSTKCHKGGKDRQHQTKTHTTVCQTLHRTQKDWAPRDINNNY